MSIIRTFGELAQEFLEQEVEAFEYMLATEGKELIVDEYEWRDNWKGFGSYDPLINLTLYLFGGKDACIDCIKTESYSIIHEELDKFLIRKNDPIYLNIDKDSNAYKLLARRFLVAEIDAYGIMEDICIGKQYEYKYKQGVSNTELDDINNSLINSKVKKWAKSSTQNYQILVNKKAKIILQKYPKLTKQALSVEVFCALSREKPIATALERDYLSSYPNF